MNNQPKRSLYRYYAIILIIILALNFIVMPLFNSSRMESTTYSDFLDSIEEKDVENVQIEDQTVYYTLKGEDNKTYETGLMNDGDLVNRLDASGANFTQVIPTQINPFVYYLLTLFLPIFIFWWFGRRMFKKIQSKTGNESMSFGQGGFGFGNLGKSNVKVYEGKRPERHSMM